MSKKAGFTDDPKPPSFYQRSQDMWKEFTRQWEERKDVEDLMEGEEERAGASAGAGAGAGASSDLDCQLAKRKATSQASERPSKKGKGEKGGATSATTGSSEAKRGKKPKTGSASVPLEVQMAQMELKTFPKRPSFGGYNARDLVVY